MAQKLRAFIAFAEDPALVASTYTVAHITSVHIPGNSMASFDHHGLKHTWAIHIYT